MKKKHLIRSKFRAAVFSRDEYKCICCGLQSTTDGEDLDAHHITPREEMPNGGYVAENGASLCAKCHILAENYFAGGETLEGYRPSDLYAKINSSFEKARKASLRLAK